MKTLRKVAELAEYGLLQNQDVKKMEKVVEQFSVAITKDMLNLIQQETDFGPISKQFIPSLLEGEIAQHELQDPIGDNLHSPVKGIVHRYPDRCLLMPIKVCPVYCRFCFRREQVGKPGRNTALNKIELKNALGYIAAHPEIWEVILSGGDPFILKPRKLAEIMQGLDAIQNVEVIRLHTRIPVVDATSITEERIQALKSTKAVYVILHANHASEFTETAVAACRRLVDAGIPMLSQTVLLQGVNDDVHILADLMRTFVKHRIKPYYLHQGDLVKGSSHFRTTIDKGQELMKALRGRYSGLCQPTYVLDIPGGYGKVPIGPQYIGFNPGKGCYCVEDYQGRSHDYSEEKN